MQNLCFETNPSTIADLLNSENDVSHEDLLRACIGLARILTDQKSDIDKLKQNLEAS